MSEPVRALPLGYRGPRRSPAPPRSEPRHGTLGGYTNHGCRCDECRKAHSLYVAAYRARRFKGKLCVIDGCGRAASASDGNGYCALHSAEAKGYA